MEAQCFELLNNHHCYFQSRTLEELLLEAPYLLTLPGKLKSPDAISITFTTQSNGA